MNGSDGYFTKLADATSIAWNRFWFRPQDVLPLCFLRILTGLVGLYYLQSWTFDLIRWFGPNGLLPRDTVRSIVDADSALGFVRSYFQLTSDPVVLWCLHGLGAVILVLFTIGCFTRVTSILTLGVLLSYIHRAPMVAEHAEPVLTMLIAYLCLAPCGRYLSVDSWRKYRGRSGGGIDNREESRFVSAAISLRLIQVHLSAFCLIFGLTKLGGEEWWNGEAIWWVMAQSESRIVDFTFLRSHIFVINAWTHAIVIFELAFGILIWNRLLRPLLLMGSVVMWSSLALASGLITFCMLMILANIAFVDPDTLRRCIVSSNHQTRLAEPSKVD